MWIEFDPMTHYTNVSEGDTGDQVQDGLNLEITHFQVIVSSMLNCITNSKLGCSAPFATRSGCCAPFVPGDMAASSADPGPGDMAAYSADPGGLKG